MAQRIQNYKRRSISIPIELDDIIQLKFKRLGYSFINDLIIELLELGIMKLNENEKQETQQKEILEKLNLLILGLENND